MSRMCVKFVSLVVLWLVHIGAATGDDPKDVKSGDFAFPDDLDVNKFRRQNYMHQHFHHNPDFHHHHHPDFHHHHEFFENEDEVDQPKDLGNESMKIPVNFIQSLNEYNVTDLLLHFVDGEEASAAVQLEDRFGGVDDDGKERSAATTPKGAACMPELRTVELVSNDDPSILYIPQCTRIERCGGCCKHDLLSCQAENKESVPFKVYKTKYTGDKKLKYLGVEVIMVERHNKCKCDCKVRPEDCSNFQEYRESACQCVCTNSDEKKKCIKYSGTKLWNNDLCTCQCRDPLQCSTGSYYDQNECRCLPVPMKRRFANYERRSIRFEPLPVVPLDEDY